MPPEFNPGNSKLRLGFERYPGLRPAAAEMTHSFRFTSETLSNEPGRIELASITGSGQRPPGLPSKIDTNGQIDVEVGVEDHLPFFVQAQEALALTSPAAGVHVARLAPSEATPAPRTFAVEAFRDDERSLVLCEGMVSAIQGSLSPRSVLTAQFQLIFGYGDYWPDAVATLDPTPNVELPVVRGLLTRAQREAEDGDLFVQVSDVSGLSGSQIRVLASVGASPSGSFESLVRLGLDRRGRPQWSELYDSVTGARLGSAPFELALLDGAGVEVGDLWQVERVRPDWTPSFSDAPPLNETHAYLLIDGEPEPIDSLEFTVTPPVSARFSIGGRFATQIRRRGFRAAAVTLNREHVDNRLRDRVESGEPFGLRLECFSGDAFLPGYEHQLTLVWPRLIAAGRTPSTTGAGERTETIQATAHPDPGNADGFYDDVTILTQSTLADPVA